MAQDVFQDLAVHVHVHDHFLKGRRFCAINVRQYAALRFHGFAKLPCKPLSGFLEGFAFPLFFFFQGDFGPAHLLCGHLFSQIGGFEAFPEEEEAGSVGNDMVEVEVEVIARQGFIQLQPEKPVLVQVHRPGKAVS